MEKLTLIKVGGKIVEEEATLKSLLEQFAQIPGNKVLVHGGGRSATKVATKLGIETQMVEGRRITDKAMLEVVTMVYAGLVNKNIVAQLQANGINSLGLTGADINYMRSDKRKPNPIDYGFVGDVREVNTEILADLIARGIVPVLSPITHDGKGNLLNTNADTIAQEASVALAKRFDVSLIYCFEKDGVLKDENDDASVIPLITKADFEAYKADGTISGGMIPKLDNAFTAISKGVKEVVITSANHILSGGTKIK
ncbi:MAG: acetylglutamate kinase [Paludibacteraceae bacterium]|nr:acetylglutamate kinase [Paludibacteraceae bacterium]